MKLRRYGFFKELDHGDPDGESIVALRGTSAYDDATKKRVVEYLKSGQLYIGCPGTVADVLADGDMRPIASADVLTDGEWAWPGDLAHYVSRYDIPVPDEMVRAMEKNEWCVRPELDVMNYEL